MIFLKLVVYLISRCSRSMKGILLLSSRGHGVSSGGGGGVGGIVWLVQPLLMPQPVLFILVHLVFVGYIRAKERIHDHSVALLYCQHLCQSLIGSQLKLLRESANLGRKQI